MNQELLQTVLPITVNNNDIFVLLDKMTETHVDGNFQIAKERLGA